jgi:hypothetical protein
MSKNNYTFILALLLFTISCAQSTEHENESNNTDSTELTEKSLDKSSTPSSSEVPEIVDEEKINKPPKEEQIAIKSPSKEEDASDESYPSGSMSITNSYLILQSTISYSAAVHTAKQVSEELDIPLDYRGYVFDFKQGLKSTETCGCGAVHEYIPRGRNDNGVYVSIEHTNSFTEFTDGYYIVVAASGKRKDLKPMLAKAQEFQKNAYIKDAEVYIGCLH